MKIKALSIIDFGKFDDKREILEINPRVALFYGKNEAGKTTIFNLIKSLLYGFSPVKSEAHPYSSRKNGRIEFSAKLTTRDGEAEVYRRLLSSPKGQVTVGDKLLELKNSPLPYAEHISSEIFNKVYSLRVEDLIDIQGRAWEEVQDKLLANYGNELIRSTREVLKDINDEAAQLYRESGKGNYLIKELENKIKDLKKEKNAALNREELLRKYDNRLKEINDLLEALVEERFNLKSSIKKAKEIMPIISFMKEIAELKGRIVLDELSDLLPPDLRRLLGELENSLRRLEEEIKVKESAIKEKKELTYITTSQDEVILENKHRINGYLSDIGKLVTMQEDLEKLKEDIDKTASRLQEEAKTILKEEPTAEIYRSIRSINYLELQAQLGINKKLQQELKEKQQVLEIKGQQRVEPKKSKGYLATALLGLPLLVASIFINNTTAMLIAGFISIFGITGMINNTKMQKEYSDSWARSNNIDRLEAEIKVITNKLQEVWADLRGLLKGIPVPEIIIDHSQDVFLTSLMRVKDLHQLLEDKNKEFHKKEASYRALEHELTEFLEQAKAIEPKGIKESIFALKDKLDLLEKQRVLNEGLQADIARLSREAVVGERQQLELQERLQSYKDKLMLLGKGSIGAGLEALESNNKIKAKIRLLEERLSHMSAYSSLKGLQQLEFQAQGLLGDVEVEKGEARLEDIEEELKNLKVERKEIEIKMQQLMEALTLDELESNLAVLEEELEAACFKRDRLLLLSEIIKRADEEFRLENQPDVLKNASRYFNIITQGRYTNIFIEDNEGTPAIYLREAESPSPRRIGENESKGTLNQLYLSLRLSLIDHLDQNNEPLPICFDELLINWDEDRLNSNLQLLEEISSQRQIFIFTCHEWMAEKIEEHFDVKRISLN